MPSTGSARRNSSLLTAPEPSSASSSGSRFDALIGPALDESLPACDEALSEAGVAAAALDAVLLVGGSARLAAVAERVEGHFGVPVLRTDRPEEAVALGAALHAQALQALEYGG